MKVYMKIMEIDPRPRYEVIVDIAQEAIRNEDLEMIELLCTNHDKALFKSRHGFKTDSKKL